MGISLDVQVFCHYEYIAILLNGDTKTFKGSGPANIVICNKKKKKDPMTLNNNKI